MAIKSVTAENLAEFAQGRNPSTAEVPAGTTKADGPTPGNPVIKAGVETKDAPPEPQGSASKPQKAKDNPVQARIDELTREKKELDEAFQDEYETRLRLEGELNALKSQQQPKSEEKPVPKELKAPDPKDYTDQAKYDADVEAYQNALIDRRVEARLAKEREQRQLDEANARLSQRITQAKKDIADFDEVIAAADRKQPIVPAHVKAAIVESELGPQIAYHLAKHPEEQKRIFALPAAKALLELGKIELQYAPKEKAEEPPPAQSPPETSKAPAPIARLKDSTQAQSVDLSRPMPFSEYRKNRIQQIRDSGRRRH